MISLSTLLEKLRLGCTGSCRVANFDQLTCLEKVDLRGYEEEVVMNAPKLREAVLHWEDISVGFDHRHPNLEVLRVVDGTINLVCLPESLVELTIDEQQTGFGSFKRFTRLERLTVPALRAQRHRFPNSLVSLTCDNLWRRPDDPPLPRLTHLWVIDPIYISDLRFGVPGVLEKIEVGGLVDGGWFPEMSSTKIRRGFLLAGGLGSLGLMVLRVPPKRFLTRMVMILFGLAVEITLLDLFDDWKAGRELRRFGRIGITREANYRKLMPFIRRSVEPAWSTSVGDGSES